MESVTSAVMKTLRNATSWTTGNVYRVGLCAARTGACWIAEHPGLTVAIAASAVIIAGRRSIVVTMRTTLGPSIVSWLILGTSSAKLADTFRAGFRKIVIQDSGHRSPSHSHPDSSADRTLVNNAIDGFIRQMGYTPYSVSMSTRDVDRNNDGTRFYFFGKDLCMDYKHDSLRRDHAIKFMDTDYYGVTMPYYAKKMRPMLLYTFVPQHVAGQIVDGSFTILDNRVHAKVNGGAVYSHELWDYDSDHLIVDDWLGSCVYLVESVKTGDPDRRLVGLFPVRRVWGPFGWLLPGKRLARREFRRGTMNINRYHDTNIPMVSVGIPGRHCCANVREEVIVATAIRLSTKTTAPSVADVERLLRENGHEDDAKVKAPQLFELLPYLRETLAIHPILSDTGVVRPRITVESIHYQTLGPHTCEDGTPMVRIVGPCLTSQGNVAPMRSYNNDSSCIEHRITAVKNEVVEWPRIYEQYAEEFIDHLVPPHLVHTGMPLDICEVQALQSRPTQVSSLMDALPTAFHFKTLVKSFQKAETYAKVAAPRNISTVDADHRTRYGGFVYALTLALLKPCDWYAFSKTPLEIAHQVQRVVDNATYVVPTDYTAWDGTHSRPLAALELQLCLRYFSPDCHNEVTTLLTSQYECCGFSKFGVRYNTGWSRLSGSSDTSAFNSIDNAFIMYVVLREQGHNTRGAWLGLGLFGGDDGLQADVSVQLLQRTAKRMGHDIKVEIKRPGEAVPFLGRYYLDPWTTLDSVIDIQRQIRKLHLSAAPSNVSADVALYCKASGLLITDPQTPIVGAWAAKICSLLLDMYGQTVLEEDIVKCEVELRQDRSWFAQVKERQSQFPQSTWQDELALKLAATQLGVDCNDVIQCHMAINACTNMCEFPVHWFDHIDRPVKITADLGGEVVTPSPIHNNNEDGSNHKQSASEENQDEQSSVCLTSSTETTPQSERSSDGAGSSSSHGGSPRGNVNRRDRERPSVLRGKRVKSGAPLESQTFVRSGADRRSGIPRIPEVRSVPREQCNRVDRPRDSHTTVNTAVKIKTKQ